MRNELVAISLFAVTVGLALVSFASFDRRETLERAAERTFAVSRMMAAHAEAAVGEAIARVDETVPLAAAWDLEDETEARAVFDKIWSANLSVSVASVGVISPDGISVVNSWQFPSEQADVSDRNYFLAHTAGHEGPLLMGDIRPGPISQRVRLTYSQPIWSGAGELHAIAVATVPTDVFNALYTEVATWPAARATLITLTGDVLAEMAGQVAAPDEYLRVLIARAEREPTGSAIIEVGDSRRLASWHRVDLAVPFVATSSQDADLVLTEWRWRTTVLSILSVLLVASFAILMMANRRARLAALQADFYRTAVSEVHHRVKNALQLSISMINLRGRGSSDPATRTLMAKLAGQLVAVAEIQDLLQHDTTLQEVDVCRLMVRLCNHLEKAGAGATIAFSSSTPVCQVETRRATYAAIVANELLTNALKHAHRNVALTLDCRDDEVALTVSDDGDGLSPDFVKEDQEGFGLRAIGMIAEHVGGTVSIENSDDGGVRARFVMKVRD
jgi:two-component sensor histidine kinase